MVRSALYEEYRNPNESYFGRLYEEIDYKCSEEEEKIGNELVNTAAELSVYSGTEQEAENEFGYAGALKQYCLYNRPTADSQEMSFRFITCRITEDEGHVWVAYSRKIKYKDYERVIQSQNILTLWIIKKQDDKWKVVKILETP